MFILEFETFDDKINKHLSKNDIKFIYKNLLEELKDYNIKLKNTNEFYKKLKMNFLNAYDLNNIKETNSKIQKIKNKFGKKYPELFI